MTSRIILVRHGPSAHPPVAGWIDRASVVRWLAGYDGVGIESGSAPPLQLTEASRGGAHLVASDLVRATESASRIAEARPFDTTPLLRELPLAVPDFAGRLPLMGWALCIHARWLLDLTSGRDRYLRDDARVASSADWLEASVARAAEIVAVTHGVMRKYLADELVSRGWERAGRTGGYRPWSAWTLSKGN